MFLVAFNENSHHSQTMTKLDVAKRIADHHTRLRRDGGKVGHCLLEQARQRFAAVALSFVVRAKIESVHMCALALEQTLQSGMQVAHILFRVKPQRNAALVRDNQHTDASLFNRAIAPGTPGSK